MAGVSRGYGYNRRPHRWWVKDENLGLGPPPSNIIPLHVVAKTDSDTATASDVVAARSVADADTATGADAASLTLPGYAGAVLADSPLLYWRLGDPSGTTVTDSSGNGRHGTYVGSPTLGVSGLQTSDADTAVGFASGKYADLASASWMNVTTITIEAWVQLSTTGAVQSIVDRDASSGSNRQFQFRVNASNQFEAIFWDSTTAFWVTTGATALTVGPVYHLVATYDGTTSTVFVDGVSDGSASHSGTLYAGTSQPLALASNNNGSFQPFTGTIDEVALYGTALSSTRVAAHYSAGSSGVVSKTSSDTATAADAVSALAVTSADTASAADAVTALAVTSSDTGSGVDTAGSVTQAYTATETATTVDTVTALAATAADTATGVDAAGTITAALTSSDAATGADTVTVRTSTHGDTATAAEAVTAASLTSSDTATGTDAVSSLITGSAVTDSDTGTAVDAVTARAVTGSDTATAADATTVRSLTDTDTATATEAVTARAATDTDTSAGVEAVTARAASSSDTATGADTVTVTTVAVTSSDLATTAETAALAALLTSTDTAAGADAVTVRSVTGSDGASTADAAPATARTSSDQGTAVDLVLLLADVTSGAPALSTITTPTGAPPTVHGNTVAVGVEPGRSSITVRTPGTATVRYTSKERP